MSLDFDFIILVVLENESFSGNVGSSSSSSSRLPARPPGGIEEGLSNITETEEEVFSTSDVNIEVHVDPEPPLLPTIMQTVSFFSF